MYRDKTYLCNCCILFDSAVLLLISKGDGIASHGHVLNHYITHRPIAITVVWLYVL